MQRFLCSIFTVEFRFIELAIISIQLGSFLILFITDFHCKKQGDSAHEWAFGVELCCIFLTNFKRNYR
ncbi:hypothetical protein CHUAL_000061 [Chamberlinius hualienensis]